MNNDQENNTNKTVDNSLRYLTCKKYDNGKTVREISEELEIKYYTTFAIIRKYKKTGVIYPKRKTVEEKNI